MAKALKLTVTLKTPDGNPGHPTRLIAVLTKVGDMLRGGATAGEFEQQYEYSQGGEMNYEIATIQFSVVRD